MKKIYLITLILIFLAGSLFSADSVRTRSALETLFADNTSGEIGAQDLRDFLKSLFVIKDDDTLFWSTDIYINSTSAEELQDWVTKLSNSSSDVDISNLTVSDSLYAGKSTIDNLSLTGDIDMQYHHIDRCFNVRIAPDDNTRANIGFYNNSDVKQAKIAYTYDESPVNCLQLINNNNTAVSIDSTGDVEIGNTTIDSVLTLEPMDTSDVAAPVEGMIIWDDSDNKPYGYNGTTWNAMW